jgi:hypothetical protein
MSSPQSPSVRTLNVTVDAAAGINESTFKRALRRRRRLVSPSARPPRILVYRNRARDTDPLPSIGRNEQPDFPVPSHTNYRELPARGNASGRIFRPHKLSYECYRNEREFVPILIGSPPRDVVLFDGAAGLFH